MLFLFECQMHNGSGAAPMGHDYDLPDSPVEGSEAESACGKLKGANVKSSSCAHFMKPDSLSSLRPDQPLGYFLRNANRRDYAVGMEVTTSDIWAQWLLHRRHGGDPERLKATLTHLAP